MIPDHFRHMVAVHSLVSMPFMPWKEYSQTYNFIAEEATPDYIFDCIESPVTGGYIVLG